MKIKSLSITNMRLIGDTPLTINFDTSKNVTLIIGENGAGKTTILDSLSYIISPFISQFPSKSMNAISEYDVHIENTGHPAPFLEISAEISEDGNSKLHDIEKFRTIKVTRTRKGYNKSPESEIKDIRAYASAIEQQIKQGVGNVTLPILAYYGTDRGNIEGPERRRYTSKTYDRWDAYTASLESATNFKRFFAWYDLMEDDERREREARQDFSYRAPVLDAVRAALTKLLDLKYSNPRILTKPLRFVMDEKLSDVTREMRIEQMSSGYKISIAMVSDLAARMAEANPDSPTPLEEEGVVLLDEIDLHLHASWQKVILSQLTTIFPHIQFIATTHSPLVVLGANDNKVQLIRLKGQKAIDMTGLDFSSYDVSMILLSEAFSLSSVYSALIEKEQNRRKDLLLKATLTFEEEKELNTLNRKLLSLPESVKDSRQQKIDEFLFDWAEKEGIL